MLDLYDEFLRIVDGLDKRTIDYALCGGMALAVHGSPRATVDIDLLVLETTVDEIITLAGNLGYTIKGKDLSLAQGKIEIRRVSKIDRESGDLLSLDLRQVTPAIEDVWRTRLQMNWENRKLSVVSREGLIALKRLRNSGQDTYDIERLQNAGNE